MRIAICEDHTEHADILRAMIDRWAQKNGASVDVKHFGSAEEFLFHWPDGGRFDLAFLDIQMAAMNGMQLAQHIRAADKAMLIVFTTGLKGFVLRGYEVNAFRYLLKPIKEQDCAAALSKAWASVRQRQAETFVILQPNRSVCLDKDEILFFEVEAHYVIVHTTSGDYRYKEKLASIEAMLGEPQFCRCHRSFLVNLRHVRLITRDQVQLHSMVCLPVSRNRWAALNECFIGCYVRKQ